MITTTHTTVGKQSSTGPNDDTPLQPWSYVCLEVSDTGRGMDEATRARIFEPFFTTKPTGRGMSMAAVMGIVRTHHGAIRVQSAVGEGSKITVMLPALVTAEAPSEES